MSLYYPIYQRIFLKKTHHMLLFVALLLLLMVTALSYVVAQDEAPNAEQAIAMANEAVKAEKNGRAKYLLDRAIEREQDNAALHIALAETYFWMDDGIGAESEAQKALNMGAKPRDIRHILAGAYLLQGDAAKAQKFMEAGDIPEDKIAMALHISALIAQSQQNYAAAAEYYQQAQEQGRETARLWADIADYRFATADLQGANDAAIRAVELNPEYVPALHKRALFLRDQYGLAAALPWFERALQLDENNITILLDYAATLGDMGHARKMLEMTRKAQEHAPNHHFAFYLQAVLAARAGEYELANQLIVHIGDRMQSVPGYLQLASLVDLQMGNHAKARQNLERLLSLQPHNQKAQKLLARTLYAQGETKKLIQQFGAIAHRPYASSYMLTLLARAYEAENDHGHALPLLQRAANSPIQILSPLPENEDFLSLKLAAENAPNNAQAIIPYVRQLIATGQASQAVNWAAQLQNQNPGVPDAHILMGDVRFALRQWPSALAAYDKAAALRSNAMVMKRIIATMKEQGRQGDIENYLVRYVALNPANISAKYYLAQAYITHGNWYPAMEILQELRGRLGDGHPILLGDLAVSELNQGRTDIALKTARRGYMLQPARMTNSQIYGLAALEVKDKAILAQEMLEKASQMNPANATTHYLLARAYAQNQQKGKAVFNLKQALAKGAFAESQAARQFLHELTAQN